MKSLLNRLKNFSPKQFNYQWLLFSISTMILLALLLLIHHQIQTVSTLTKNEISEAEKIFSQLGTIDDELSQLSTQRADGVQFHQTLAQLSQDLAAVKNQIAALASTEALEKLSTQITTFQTDVDNQITNLKTAVVNHDDKNFIDPKVLPFQVIAVDVISNQVFVSINYQHHITPLMLGDGLAGWQVVEADYANAEVIFKNARNQYVKVAVAG